MTIPVLAPIPVATGERPPYFYQCAGAACPMLINRFAAYWPYCHACGPRKETGCSS